MSLLVENGIDQTVFYKAYFEDFSRNESANAGHIAPHLKTLFNESNKVFGAGFLVKLDKLITANGVGRVLATWKKEGDNFPNWLFKLK